MGPIRVASEHATGRILVTDSLSYCDDRVTSRDVVVAGSFAGHIAFAFAFEHGVRALIAHAAGVGKDEAGIAGLADADARDVPAAAVETMSARIGDGESVWADGVIAHVNAAARRLGARPGMRAAEAAHCFLAAHEGAATPGVVNPVHRVVLDAPAGRVVLMGSTSFATAENRHDVIVVGSHAGHVNALPLLRTPVRALIAHDAGMARDASGIGALPFLAGHGIAAMAVSAASARIGDPASAWDTGMVSAANTIADRSGVRVGMRAQEAAAAILREHP